MESRPDNNLAIRDMTIIQLQQECKEWEAKYRAEKQEALCLAGASSKANRMAQAQGTGTEDHKNRVVELEAEIARLTTLRSHVEGVHKKTIAGLKTNLDAKNSVIDGLMAEVSQTRRLVRTAELETEAAKALRLEVAKLQQEIVQLKNLHANTGCEEFAHSTAQQVAEALRMQQAAEADVEALGHVQKANTLIQEQNALVQSQLLAVMRENREAALKVQELEQAVEIHRAAAIKAEDQAAQLEDDLLIWKPIPSRSHEVCPNVELTDANSTITPSVAEASQAFVLPSLVFSDILAVSVEPKAAAVLMVDSHAQTFEDVPSSIPILSYIDSVSTKPPEMTNGHKPDINLIINISRAEQKNWTFLRRVQSAISMTSKLDIIGPCKDVQDFVAAMDCAAADHTEKTAAAAHWQNVALQSLAEIDSLRSELNSRPACSVFTHRNLSDELEAKDTQLQIQASVVAQWQKKMARVRAYMDDANKEMRERGMGGV